MKVRHTQTGTEGTASVFNVHGIGEMIVTYPDGEASSERIADYEVFVEALGRWKAMPAAFHDRDIIVDNYNTRFFEPRSPEDRERGYAS